MTDALQHPSVRFPDGFLWGTATAAHQIEGVLDDVEWTLGYGPTFGLVAVDRETSTRTPQPSLAWLGEVARRNGLPSR